MRSDLSKPEVKPGAQIPRFILTAADELFIMIQNKRLVLTARESGDSRHYESDSGEGKAASAEDGRGPGYAPDDGPDQGDAV